MGKGLTHKYRLLGRLDEQIQRDVLDGKASQCSINDLLKIAAIQHREQQLEAFEQLVAMRAQQPARQQRKAKLQSGMPADKPQKPKTIRVRAVAYFNPERFVDQRLSAHGWLRSIQEFTKELNAKLASPRSKLTRDGIVAAVDRKLRSYDLVAAFDLQIKEHKASTRSYFQIELQVNGEQWSKRRRYDGFTVLVTHPNLPHEPEKLCRLYRSKDAVEKDFQTIKSLVKLRPIRHHTNSKVRAHVTLCMLALLLERTLKHKLGKDFTSAAVLELLSNCYLNRYCANGGSSSYVITEPDQEQRSILRTLRLQHIADDEEIADRITPR